MPSKKKLLEKLFRNQIPKDFSIRELNQLMGKCHCISSSGGRGSAIKYYHTRTGRILQFDAPHPGSDLYAYHIKMVRIFIEEIGEKDKEE